MKTRRFISLVILCFCWFAGAAIFTSAAQAPGTYLPPRISAASVSVRPAIVAISATGYPFSAIRLTIAILPSSLPSSLP